MNRINFRNAYVEELIKIAPDIDPSTISDDDHIQDDLELDSMDILNLVTALHERFGISIPETDYDEISTPSRAADYLERMKTTEK